MLTPTTESSTAATGSQPTDTVDESSLNAFLDGYQANGSAADADTTDAKGDQPEAQAKPGSGQDGNDDRSTDNTSDDALSDDDDVDPYDYNPNQAPTTYTSDQDISRIEAAQSDIREALAKGDTQLANQKMKGLEKVIKRVTDPRNRETEVFQRFADSLNQDAGLASNVIAGMVQDALAIHGDKLTLPFDVGKTGKKESKTRGAWDDLQDDDDDEYGDDHDGKPGKSNTPADDPLAALAKLPKDIRELAEEGLRARAAVEQPLPEDHMTKLQKAVAATHPGLPLTPEMVREAKAAKPALFSEDPLGAIRLVHAKTLDAHLRGRPVDRRGDAVPDIAGGTTPTAAGNQDVLFKGSEMPDIETFVAAFSGK